MACIILSASEGGFGKENEVEWTGELEIGSVIPRRRGMKNYVMLTHCRLKRGNILWLWVLHNGDINFYYADPLQAKKR